MAVVRPGQILFEVEVEDHLELARTALIRAGHKLPVRWRIVEKSELS